MNTKKILSVMPYVLGVLILILVGVIIFSKLGTEGSGDTVSTPTPTLALFADDKNKNEVTSQPAKQEEKTPDVITEAPEPTEAAQEPSPEPTKEPDPTPTPVPTPTPIADLTYGLKFEPRADYVDVMNGVNLRKGCSTDTDKVAFLEEGIRLERTGYNSEWTRVIYKGQECYIATFLVIREVDSMDAVVTPTPGPDESEGAGTDDENGASGTGNSEAAGGSAEGSTETGNNGDSAGADNGSATAGANLEKSQYYGAGAGKTVCIDPGHQTKGNSGTEPLGPGSDEMKTKVSSGTQGVSTGLEEYKLNLTVSLMLRDELVSRGYTVIMTRTTNDVDITNAERAQIANEADADAFIRVHANSSSNSSAKGIETICITPDNPFVSSMYSKCRKLSDTILNNTVARTGATKRAVWETDSMTGSNWSQVPTTIVEMGFMSNETEDKRLSDTEYQKKIVTGIADGIDEYFAN